MNAYRIVSSPFYIEIWRLSSSKQKPEFYEQSLSSSEHGSGYPCIPMGCAVRAPLAVCPRRELFRFLFFLRKKEVGRGRSATGWSISTKRMNVWTQNTSPEKGVAENPPTTTGDWQWAAFNASNPWRPTIPTTWGCSEGYTPTNSTSRTAELRYSSKNILHRVINIH